MSLGRRIPQKETLALAIAVIGLLVSFLSFRISYLAYLNNIEERVLVSINNMELQFKKGSAVVSTAASIVLYNASQQPVTIRSVSFFGVRRSPKNAPLLIGPPIECSLWGEFANMIRIDARDSYTKVLNCDISGSKEIESFIIDYTKKRNTSDVRDALIALYRYRGIDFAGNKLPQGISGDPAPFFPIGDDEAMDDAYAWVSFELYGYTMTGMRFGKKYIMSLGMTNYGW